MMKNSAEQSQEWLQQYRAGLCAGADRCIRRLDDPMLLDTQERGEIAGLLALFSEFMESMVDFGDDPLERMWRERRDERRVDGVMQSE